MCGQRPYAIVFYETPQGDKPVLRWIKEDLSVRQRRALGYAPAVAALRCRHL